MLAQEFARQFPDRTPGSEGAPEARAGWRKSSSQYGFRTSTDRFHAKIPGRGRVQLENLLAFRQGRSNEVIAVIAHRDNSGAGPGANDNASGTAALLELARTYAIPRSAPRPPEPTTRSCSSRPTAARSEASGRPGSSSDLRTETAWLRSISFDAIAGAGPAAPHLRGRSAPLALGRARPDSRGAHRRADGRRADTGKRAGTAPRPRVPVQPLRAGAVHRPRNHGDHAHLRGRPAAGRLRRTTG